MPIVMNPQSGLFILVCVNGHRSQDNNGSTMVAVEDWLSIPTTAAPGASGPGRLGMMLRCYHCSVCGYVEMYMPPGAAPEASNG